MNQNTKRTKQIGGKTYRLHSLIEYPNKRDAQRSADEIRSCGYYVRVVRNQISGTKKHGYKIWVRRMG